MTATTQRARRPGRQRAQRAVSPRRRLLAAAVAAQPLLLAVNGTFHPDVEMKAASLLAATADGANSWYAVHLIAAIGAMLGAPAAFGLRTLLRERNPLGDIALVTAVAAAVVLPLSFMAEASVLRLATTADIDNTAALAIVDHYLQAPEFYAVGIGVLAASLATALFSTALLMERRVGLWLPSAAFAGTIVALVAQPGSAVAPVAFGIVAVSGIGLARHVAADTPLTAPPRQTMTPNHRRQETLT